MSDKKGHKGKEWDEWRAENSQWLKDPGDPSEVKDLLNLIVLPGTHDYSRVGFKAWHRRLEELWSTASDAEKAAAIHIAFARIGGLWGSLVDIVAEARNPTALFHTDPEGLALVAGQSDAEHWKEAISPEDQTAPYLWSALREVVPEKYWDRLHLTKKR